MLDFDFFRVSLYSLICDYFNPQVIRRNSYATSKVFICEKKSLRNITNKIIFCRSFVFLGYLILAVIINCEYFGNIRAVFCGTCFLLTVASVI